MADEASPRNALVGILPVLVGGLLTLAGGWTQAWYQGRQAERQRELAMYDKQLVEIDAYSDTVAIRLHSFKDALDSLDDALRPGANMYNACLKRHSVLKRDDDFEGMYGHRLASFFIYFAPSAGNTIKSITKTYPPLLKSLDTLLHCNPVYTTTKLSTNVASFKEPHALIDTIVTRAEFGDSYLAALRIERHMSPGAYVDSVGSRAQFIRRVLAWNVTDDSASGVNDTAH